MPRLTEDGLHGSLREPVLGSISFLNEIMSRHPKAISFAPGAPRLTDFDESDVAEYIGRYLDHLCADLGYDRERARRLIREYGPSRGLIGDLIADALRLDEGIRVPGSSVVITVGAQEAMLLALRVLFGSSNDLLAVANPGFPGVVGAARLLEIGVVPVADRGQGLDVDALAACCRATRHTGRRVRAVYVSPDFANPTGTVLEIAARRRLLELACREDFLVLEDSVYGFTAEPGSELLSLKALDQDTRVVRIGTFSKVCLPGARVGFVVADQAIGTANGSPRLLADELATAKSMVTVNTAPVCQAVIGGMLLAGGGSLAALGRRQTAMYRRNLALLLDALSRRLPPGPSWNRPVGGFFVRLRVPVPVDLKLLELSAAVHGVLWTPMSQFYLDGNGSHEMRLSCSYLEPDQIDEGVDRLASLLKEVM